MLKNLAIIPARRGSKGIPKKNIKLFFGKPLIAWTIEAALASKKIDSIVVSTDCPEIAAVAESYGVAVPNLRPDLLSQDTTPTMDVVRYELSIRKSFDWVTLLQPTSPLRTSYDIDGIIDHCLESGSQAAVSVCESHSNPCWMFTLTSSNQLKRLLPTHIFPPQRQEHPLFFQLNGALYVANTNWLANKEHFVSDETIAYVMPNNRSIDIDDPIDWRLAELLMEENS